jgi:hypothetical protein
MRVVTDDRRVKAISQILYGQYRIWDWYVLGLKSKSICKKNEPNTQNHGQGTHSAKVGIVVSSLTENTQNAPTFLDPICLHKPKSLGFSKKNSVLVSVCERGDSHS